MRIEQEKFILDPCCGPKYMWIDKKHPNVIYGDIRREKKGFHHYRRNLKVEPDIVLDFRDLPFPDKSFKLIVFDPPHLFGNKANFHLGEVFGSLSKLTWQRDLKQGFDECWRVLEEYGILIFKWSDSEVSFKSLLKILGHIPLFHNTFGHIRDEEANRTYWACFMRLPEEYIAQQTLEEVYP